MRLYKFICMHSLFQKGAEKMLADKPLSDFGAYWNLKWNSINEAVASSLKTYRPGSELLGSNIVLVLVIIPTEW
jgi:hypothetical protein